MRSGQDRGPTTPHGTRTAHSSRDDRPIVTAFETVAARETELDRPVGAVDGVRTRRDPRHGNGAGHRARSVSKSAQGTKPGQPARHVPRPLRPQPGAALGCSPIVASKSSIATDRIAAYWPASSGTYLVERVDRCDRRRAAESGEPGALGHLPGLVGSTSPRVPSPAPSGSLSADDMHLSTLMPYISEAIGFLRARSRRTCRAP